MNHPLLSSSSSSSCTLRPTSSPIDALDLSASSSPTASTTMGLSSKQVAADGDTLGWPQTGNAWLDIPSPDGQARNEQQQQQRLKCPRCDSHNTKFCYYNNYSRMQPRHLCKACKRYWTEGGTLRNVPVGGGRKNKRQKKTVQADPAEADNFRHGSRVLNCEQFSNGDLEIPVFPAFNRIMMYPPSMSPDHDGGGGSLAMSLLSPPLLLPEISETYSGSGILNPPPVSASASSSHHSNQIRQEGATDDLLLTLMPGSTTETWIQDPTGLLQNYYSPWWDDAGELAALEKPAPANDQQEP